MSGKKLNEQDRVEIILQKLKDTMENLKDLAKLTEDEELEKYFKGLDMQMGFIHFHINQELLKEKIYNQNITITNKETKNE